MTTLHGGLRASVRTIPWEHPAAPASRWVSAELPAPPGEAGPRLRPPVGWPSARSGTRWTRDDRHVLGMDSGSRPPGFKGRRRLGSSGDSVSLFPL